jgi:hypothetical protein
MQETEQAERALIDYLRTAESSPTESGDIEARAASMAKSVAGLLTLRAGRASVMVVDGTPVVRVRMRSGAGQRTVTAGVSAFAQVMDQALNEMPRRLVAGAMEALVKALPDEARRMHRDVMAAAEKLTSDPETVRKWRDSLAATRAEKTRKEREELVSRMASLLADGGWTLDMLSEAVSESCARNVMSA